MLATTYFITKCLSKVFCKLYFLQNWFIVSVRGDILWEWLFYGLTSTGQISAVGDCPETVSTVFELGENRPKVGY